MTKKTLHTRFLLLLLCCGLSVSILKADIIESNCLITLDIADYVSAEQGGSICVPVTVENYTDILFMQFGITWDASLLSFEEIASGVLDLNNAYNSPSPGLLYVSFTEPSLNPLTFPDNTILFELCFTAMGTAGDLAAISFLPNDDFFIEIGNGTAVLPSTLIGGSVQIEGNAPATPLSIAEDCSIACTALDIIVSGGQVPYAYLWEGSNNYTSTDEDLSGVPAGSYSLTVTDANGETVSATFSVDNSYGLSLSAYVVPINCLDANSGSVQLDVNNGVPPYTFAWSNGATTEDINNLSVGTYVVTVSDANGCNIIATYQVEEEGLIVSNAYLCQPDDLAELTVLVFNSQEDYTFECSNGATASSSTSAIFSDLPAGNYSVTVTGQTSGCSTVEGPIAISCPLPPVSDCFTVIANSANTDPGDQICIPVTAQGFENILGVQFSLAWDTQLLDYTGVTSAALTTNTINDAIPGKLAFIWLAANPGAGGLTLADGSTLFEVCFDVIGTAGSESAFDISAMPTDYEAVVYNNGLPEEIGFNAIQGQVFVGNVTTIPVITDICGTAPACGGSNGTASVTVTGGQQPYVYEWYDGSGTVIGTTPTIEIFSGNYFEVIVTDANGTTANGFVSVLFDGPDIHVNLIEHVTCNGANNGSINIYVSGGNGAYSYSWSNGDIMEDLSDLPAGTYIITVTDANGCSATQNYIVNEPAALSLELVNTTCPTATGNDGVLEVAATGGVTAYSYSWSNGANTALLTGLDIGTYMVTVTDAAGCTITESYFLGDCVWPGDTDTTGVVNNFDLLNIGLAAGTTGTARPNASISWTAQPSSNWPESTPNSNVNYKHIDTDGNGIVNAMDTLAIMENWGEMHNFTGDPDQQFGSNLPPSGNLLSIPFYVLPDTVQAGATVALPVMLGDANNPVVDLYGLAFTVTFDPEVVVPGSAHLTFEDSWVGDINNNMITIQKTFHGDGRVDVGMTRMDGNNMDGQGAIAKFFITIEDDVVFKGADESKSLLTMETLFGIENVRLITNLEEEILATPIATTTLIESISTATEDWEDADTVMLYPNPVSTALYIKSPLASIESIRVYDVMGRILQTENYPLTKEVVLNTNGLNGGAYLVKIQTEKGQVVRRIIVMK